MSDPLFPGPKYPVPAQKPEKPAVPKEVNIAFAVWVFSAIVSAVLQALDADVFVDAFMKQSANQPPEAQLPPSAIRTMFYVALAVVGLLMLLFAWKMRSGRNWARILLTVLAVFGLYTQASAVGFSDWLAVVSVAITATGLVYMYMPPSNAYFRSFRKVPPQQR
ncbi:hypothetical protein [Kibdelosporangium phytohabitans]|uniref:Uncharacterized protein n=1 Tax=Kibdelosporangium phytohabitans TaxID=860235 RepID=A0A0N9IGH7_9PSEU|nr:hypothetical protein [Kibdelosporangium phytohabitans]ALG14013.1 hypothetical protein AOZ06_50465 [Kibdelosporangium phytohabitans]MBE1467032.1 uncharacterized membrane protein YhaH (DUF805 family) [Kibdelosporangium phytohabitans]